MSQQGLILIVSSGEPSPLAAALSETKMFPVIETSWTEAAHAVEQLQPAALLVSGDAGPGLAALAAQIAEIKPYVPLVVIDPKGALPENALPFSSTGGSFERLSGRLRAALRVRSLHATVLRRMLDDPIAQPALTDPDPIQDATVLLIGRGAAYPALSVALGERMGVVGALSIEAAAKHLNVRDLDGIVLAEGFSPRVLDAFLTVLAEDVRFRHLPVVVSVEGLTPSYDLPNLELISGEPARIAANALPLIRQHAFEAGLSRALKSIDAGGLLDTRTGLLTLAAFNRDFATAVYQTQSRGGGLSVARFSFGPSHERAQLDGGRIISRLMRQMDFGAVQDDGSIVVAFAETDLRNAHMIARRLGSVMKHTIHTKRAQRVEPDVTVATLLATDSAKSMLARLTAEGRRAAS
ncbi:GGDEF domain-containing protein [Bradyrhizobium sp.]|uniref:GGDEF domain-containing protein n=1 Tax=Bradyrhizobium sp. TaxID=376 RepID=UPI002E02D4D5|nr:GGDEF domain-containing protein [Bradyrhizobium sp.]